MNTPKTNGLVSRWRVQTASTQTHTTQNTYKFDLPLLNREQQGQAGGTVNDHGAAPLGAQWNSAIIPLREDERSSFGDSIGPEVALPKYARGLTFVNTRQTGSANRETATDRNTLREHETAVQNDNASRSEPEPTPEHSSLEREHLRSAQNAAQAAKATNNMKPRWSGRERRPLPAQSHNTPTEDEPELPITLRMTQRKTRQHTATQNVSLGSMKATVPLREDKIGGPGGSDDHEANVQLHVPSQAHRGKRREKETQDKTEPDQPAERGGLEPTQSHATTQDENSTHDNTRNTSPTIDDLLEQLNQQIQADKQRATNQLGAPPMQHEPTNHNPQRAGEHHPTKQQQRTTRAHIQIATLNMDGRTHKTIKDTDTRDKWSQIYDRMRDDRIGILALQETHLSPEMSAEVQKHRPRIKVIGSAHENATSTAGIVLVLNRQQVENAEDTPYWEIIPGRALAASVNWHGQKLHIMTVYGPNDANESSQMWSMISDWLEAPGCPIPKLDILLGDMNFVEDEIDRQPMHLSRVDEAATEFSRLRIGHNLIDGWRARNPGTLEFTWRRRGQSQRSRLDRIYLAPRWAESDRNWQTINALTGTDHYMVSVVITDHQSPKIGEGRFAIPNNVIDSREFLTSVKPILKALHSNLTNTETTTNARSPQILWAEFKDQIGSIARTCARKLGSIASRRIVNLNNERRIAQNPTQDNPEPERSVEQIESEIEDQRARLARRRGDNLQAAAWIQHDAQTKEMYSQTRPVGPKARLKSIRIADGPNQRPRWTENSTDITEAFRAHYDSVQKRELDVDPAAREAAIQEILLNPEIPRAAASTDFADMNTKVTRDLIELALRESASGTAPGIDGIPYELWKKLAKLYDQTKNSPDPWPDITGILTRVFNDIEEHGVHPCSHFHRGWLCPLFKKGNPDEPANYRPITLLNTDYKTLSKALSIRLAKAAPSLIHKDQAGFMPGRSIFDQCKLARLMIHWGEAEQLNGAIVCLDQEKAYDRIRHDYLKRSLAAYGLPAQFIQTVMALYTGTHTTIIVNGMLSDDMLVTRGVRQGDPLSCLLFNLAIEPLACMLRTSNLRGFELPRSTQKLIVSLFADDTCIYLSEYDDPRKLWAITDKWCLASGAKFNEKKTEVVPIGQREYRDTLHATRRIYPLAQPFHPSIHIAREGEAVRLLGAYIGNGIDQQGPWKATMDSVRSTIEKWKPKNLTLTGRAMIAQSIIGGKTQYLATVQGMPIEIERELTKTIADLLWDADGLRKRATVNPQRMSMPVSQGGKALLLPEMRNTAIQIGLWFKKLMQPAAQRPPWVEVALGLMNRQISPNALAPSEQKIARTALVNPFLQQWRPKRGSIPPDLQRLITAVSKSGYELDAPLIPEEVKLNMPLWLHYARRPGSHQKPRTPAANDAATCLQTRHCIIYVHEAIEALKVQFEPTHEDDSNCPCLTCDYIRSTHNCNHPTQCYTSLRATLADILPQWRPNSQLSDPQPPLRHRIILHCQQPPAAPITSLSSQTNTHHILPIDLLPKSAEALVRVFTRLQHPFTRRLLPAAATHLGYPSLQQTQHARPVQSVWIAIAVHMSPNNGTPSCSVGLAFTSRSHPPLNLRIESPTCSCEQGAIAGLLLALQSVHPDTPTVVGIENKALTAHLTKRLKRNIEAGWIATGTLAPSYRAVAAALVRRTPGTTISRFRTHPMRHEANKQALVADTQEKQSPPKPAYASLALRGRQLSKISQGTAQRTLIATQKVPLRKATLANMSLAIESAGAATGSWPSEARVWTSLRSRDLHRPTREFLWKLMHGTFKVGAFWFNVEDHEERGRCGACNGATESMQHILLECCAPGQSEIWKLTADLADRTDTGWNKPDFGAILTCSTPTHQNRSPQHPGSLRRRRILSSEAAFLIWRIRCERVIQNENDPTKSAQAPEIKNRWKAAIERRIRLDIQFTNRRRFGSRALKLEDLRNTWEPILLPGSDPPPENWWSGTGFLVRMW